MKQTKKLVLAAMFLALALVLPFLTGQIPQVGSMLCPMHIPVLLCGFFCGWQWGLAVGLIAPILRSLTLGMPPMFPTALCMAFELAAYGAFAGFLYEKLAGRKFRVYLALIGAMVLGRAAWGIVSFAVYNRALQIYRKSDRNVLFLSQKLQLQTDALICYGMNARKSLCVFLDSYLTSCFLPFMIYMPLELGLPFSLRPVRS